MSAFLSSLVERPERGLVALIAAQAVFWSLAPALSHSAPPLDVVEMYAWGREGVVATFKHPNLPGLVLEGVRRGTGLTAWQAAFFVSQLFIGLTLWSVFALGRELMDGKRALAGALLLTGVVFFSWPTTEFNHNVAQMPLWALTCWMLWRVTTRGDLLSWLLLGVFAGLSMWAKYSSAVLLVVAAAWILWDGTARKRLLTLGPWLGLLACAAVVAPQALWLIEHDFQPFAYAARRAAGGGIGDALAFLPVEALNHLPMALLLLAAGWFGKAAADAPAAPDTRALRFLLLLGLGPALLTAIAGALTGSGLKTAWGAPMFNLSGLLVVALLANRFSTPRLQRLVVGAGVLLVLLPGLYFAHMRYGAHFTGEPLRGNWPQARVGRALESAWAREVPNAPLRIVAGDIWTAGLVGMTDEHPPSVWINGDPETSPWITPERLRSEGVMMVWREGAAPPQALADTSAVPSRVIVPFDDASDSPPLRINYLISPPAN
ncbi:MAG: glycosyltransferase family 39 protein [Terricaulis sp.]